MMPAQLKETTMNPDTRTLARVSLPTGLPKDLGKLADLVETLMGKKPELRFRYIQDNAKFVDELDV
jgi:topoisomerase-4 subunit B